ncbi:MAG TPA: HisA/HisF-related TIM barrel protein [Solirubrobacteraceae bacterium]|nr:HisA/HisF-related TIM barrel protein [Solirubrobacteraceae bacterium]
MRLIPVIDVRDGVVVHARGGARADYRPLRSPLVDSARPAAVARALSALCGGSPVYVADLPAIAGAAPDAAMLAQVSAVAEAWVDAGATTARRARALAAAGAARNVLGTESLRVARAPAGGPAPALSVDLRDGRLVTALAGLTGREPLAAAPLAGALGVREVIVIELTAVGMGTGPALQAVQQLARALPGVEILAGGGVRDDRDLRALARAGASGALVATALHEGRVTPG